MSSLVQIADASIFIPGDPARKLILEQLNLQVEMGRHLCIAGANGSGKSTLLRLIAGKLWPASGKISWRNNNGAMDDSPITGQSVTALVSPQKQIWLQNYAWPISAGEFIAQATPGQPEYLAAEIIGSIKNKPLPELSQGQLRLAILARALTKKPALLLLDEWSDGLDNEHRTQALELLAKAAGCTTMIFASHRKQEVPDWVTRNLWLEGGRLHQAPCAKQAACTKLSKQRAEKATADGQPIYMLENASVYLERKLILEDINWTTRQGEHWRIEGANGSGKSTLLRTLAGDEVIAAGGRMVHFSPRANRELTTLTEKRQSAVLASDLSQACYGYNLTGIELLLSGLDNTTGLYRTFEEKEFSAAARLLRKIFGIKEAEAIRDMPFRQMSNGQQKRLFLARALMNRPEVLLLDEPFSGLDRESRMWYLAALSALAAGDVPGLRPQIIIVCHYDEDVPEFINRRARMEKGRLTS